MAATRVSITIPDDLAERLEPYRDRMNISKVCARAIERELSDLTELPAAVEELNETIARLRMEKDEREERDYLTGLDWGRSYAEEEAEFLEFGFYETLLGHAEPSLDELPAKVRDDFTYSQNDGASVYEYSPDDIFVYNPDKFAEGWVDGLLAVWEAIKDKV